MNKDGADREISAFQLVAPSSISMSHGTGIESLLRDLIKRAALGRALRNRGLDCTLDQLARGRRTEPRRLTDELEVEIVRILTQECGTEWATLLRKQWDGFKMFTMLGLNRVDHAQEPALPYGLNFLGLFLRTAWRDKPGLDVESWLNSPFRAWVDFICAAFTINRRTVRMRICAPANGTSGVSERTYDRWLAGDNIRALTDGHRALTEAAAAPVEPWVIDHLSGWLLITIAVQSMDLADRQHLTSVSPFVGLARPAHHALPQEKRSEACQFVGEVTGPYQDGELSGCELERRLDAWHVVAKRHPMLRVQYGRLRARSAAGRGDDARHLYEQIIDASAHAGCADNEHQACVLEALAYSRSIGSKQAFRHFWDRARKSMIFGFDTEEIPSPEQSAYIDRIVDRGPRSLRLVVINEIA